MQKWSVTIDKKERDGFPQARKMGLPEFERYQLGVGRQTVVLFINRDLDNDDQIAVLEEVVGSFPMDISMCILEEESIVSFAQKYHVKGSPTYLLFESGLEKGRLLGKSDHKDLLAFLKMHLATETGSK
ncbi:MAG: hypothetical protein GY866_26060 [Proteobacteria bacterium]|nr:hypothetical protein [Pseudomonadota bacterium]